MSALEKLLSVSSPPTGVSGDGCSDVLPQDICSLLLRKNGFFAFESSLEVFSLDAGESYSVFEWNNPSAWLESYEELKPNGICFAQDIFGAQFVYGHGVSLFDPETGGVSFFAESIEQWAEFIMNDYEVITGQPIAHTWQSAHGPIPPKHRLVPLTPFVLGGDFSSDNVIIMESMKSMRLRASLAHQICDLPDEHKFRMKLANKTP